jgi:PAS domain S-box-containing protein
VLDITERKRAEAQLAEQQTLLQNLIESSGNAVFSVDHAYRYTSFNRQHAAIMKALYGVDIELGQSLLDYQRATEDHLQAKGNIDRALAGEHLTDEAYSGEDARTRAYFEVSHHPIRDDLDHIVGVAVFARDTTARRRAEEELRILNAELDERVAERTAQLEESNKELDAFSYSVSHDLRAPLRAIDGFTRILVDEYASDLDAEGKRLCSVIRENTGKMSRLIDELLGFARLGRAALNPTEIDMQTMATSVYFELTTADSRACIDFQVDALPTVVADPTLIRQVWTNLLSNAIKFSSKRERVAISVSAKQSEGDGVYVVSDNGAGFDMQYRDKLFGVFQRLHNSREFDGTGVGLALVQRIVRRHGGRVWAEGEVDRGASFCFALPYKGEPT